MNLDEEFDKIYGNSSAATDAPDLDAEFDAIYGDAQTPAASAAPAMTEAEPAAPVAAEPKPTTLMERMANGDIDSDIAEWKKGYDVSDEIAINSMGQPIGRKKVSRAGRSDQDAMAALATEAGLEDWQVKRLREESKSPEEMREALRYVAGNRRGAVGGEEESAGLKSVPRTVVNTGLKLASAAANLVGTALGGVDEEARHTVMVDDPMAKNEGESFDDWLKRMPIDPRMKVVAKRNPQVREDLERFFKWEAPIAGKESQRMERSVVAENGREGTAVGNLLVGGAARLREFADERVPVGNSGSGLADWVENAASGITQFAYAGPTMIAMSPAEAYQETRSKALASGKTPEQAEGLAAGSAAFNGLMTTAFYVGPFRRWARGKKIVPAETLENFTFKEMSAAAGRHLAKIEAVNQAIATGESSTIMGLQGMGETAIDMLASGREVDIGEIAVRGLEGLRDGAIIGAVLGSARIANAKRQGARNYESFVRSAAETPQGRFMFARMNPEGMSNLKSFLDAHKDFVAGSAKEAKNLDSEFRDLCNKAGLPADTDLARKIVDSKEAGYVFANEWSKSTSRPSKVIAVDGGEPAEGESGGPDAPVLDSPSEAAAKSYTERFGAKPVEFQLPTTPDGKPDVHSYKTTDKRTGRTLNNVIATDKQTGVSINENGDGTYTVFNEQEDNPDAASDDANSLEEAVEKAKMLAIKDQYTAAERKEKDTALRNLLEQNPPSFPVDIRSTMQEALAEAKAAGYDLAAQPGFKMDAPFVTAPNGAKVLILDNLDNPKTALAALDKDTPNDRGAFADGVEFATEAAPDENGDVTETKIARDKVHGVSIIDAGDGTFVVYNDNGGYDTASSLEEAVAVANGAKPKPIQPKAETTTQEQANENRTNEAPAQPASEQPTSAGQAEVEAAKPVESAEAPREAPNARVVEPPAQPAEDAGAESPSVTKSAKPAENSPTTAPKPAEAQTPTEPAKPVEAASRASEAVWTDRTGKKHTLKGFDAPTETNVTKGSFVAIRHDNGVLYDGEIVSVGAKNIKVKTSGGFGKGEMELTFPRKDIVGVRRETAATSAPTAEDERKAADRKAKRDAMRAKTLESAKAVTPPSWLGKNAGPKESRMSDLTGYLADRTHNRASLHRAIQGVREYMKQHVGLALSEAESKVLAEAVSSAQRRLEKMKKDDQKAFGERNAEIPKSLLTKYLKDHPDPVLERLAENGAIFNRPRSARAAKRAAGGKSAVRDARFDGKLFDPGAAGADELNLFFDGMKGAERDRWLRIVFGRDTKEANEPVVTGNDGVAESLGLSVGEILENLRTKIGAFQAWRDAGAESEEDRHYRELYEEEQYELDKKFGAPTDQFRIDELEAREEADKEYAAAKAFVENKATAKDIAVYSPSALSAAEEGDAIRIDHQEKTYDFISYDAKNGILIVGDWENEAIRRFRVTEDGFAEIKEENENGNRRTDETGSADNGASDEEGAGAGGSREEGEGGRAERGGPSVGVGDAAGGKSASIRQRDGRADGRRDIQGVQEQSTLSEKSEVRRLYRVLADADYAAAHPEELKEALDLLKKGVSVSAVVDLPLTETDKATWPFAATRVNTREDCANLGRLLSRPTIETSKVLYLDKDGNILRADIHSVGFVGDTIIDYEQIVNRAPNGTYGVVLMHNHPNQQGDEVGPSTADMSAGLKLKQRLEKAGLLLLDDIITDHNAFYTVVGEKFVNGLGEVLTISSNGAEEFWARNEARGNSIEKPVDNMNMVPYGERTNLAKLGGNSYITKLAAAYAKVNKADSYVVGIDASGNIVYISKIPENVTKESAAEFFKANKTANRFAVMLGSRPFDRRTFLNGADSLWDGRDTSTAPSVVFVYSLSGDKMLSYDLTQNQGYTKINPFFAGLEDGWSDADVFLPDKDAAKPAAPAPAPRLANAPKLNDAASKAIDDILGEMGGLLHSTIEPIYTGTAADYANRSRQGGVDDGPSVKYIGTGEGSQVYGWGLYGSTERGVAEGYAGVGETLYRNKNTGEIRSLEFGPKYKPMAMGDYDYYSGNVTPEASKKGWERISGQEHLYEQTWFTNRAPGDESHLLKWYEPVSEEQLGWIVAQSEKEGWSVQRNADGSFVIDPHDANAPRSAFIGEGETGQSVYESLSRALGESSFFENPQAASEFLARAGIDGVKYPVDSFGGKTVKDGDVVGWNYVSFRDDNIRVDHKWTDGEQLYSPVEPLSLSREEERKFRDAVERMVETLADNGYTKFDDLARVVASRRPDIYGRAKDLLRRSWNFVARDPADEITIARGNEIFGIIDNELNRETTNDLGTDAVDAGQRDGAQDNGGERDRADRGLSVPAGTGDGGAGQGSRRPGGGERPAAPVRTGAGGLPVDVREDDGHRGGDGGYAVGQRAVGLGRRDGGYGEVQRDSEGAVPRVGEEVSPGFTAYEPPSDLPVAAPKSQSLIVEPSALASIPQPPIKSKPDIPDSIPKGGVLQAHQYEAVCRAVDSQNKTLPDGRRQGFFVGDGTGAGKTRIIAGVMLDAVNRNLGKGKALIISKNKELYDGALGDFEPFGISNRLFDLTDPKWKTRLEKNSRGIAFVTYPSLAQNYAGTDGEGNVRSAGKRGKTLNRYEEIVKWLGKDFDGVIALDEAHSAAKDDGTTAQQAKRSQAVIDLQNALPNARVLYLTATAAYDAKDLRFLTRMGLWGEGTGFSTFSSFADAVNRGGLSMMEILTQGMKAAGKYCSRSISFKGVNCKRVVANVTPEQKQTYADYSSVLSRIHDVAMSLEGVTGAPRKYLSSQYFGRALDLFNSLITSMKVGKAIELGRQAIAEGKSPVFQLISTNDSAKDAKKTAVPTRKEYDMLGNIIREVPVEDAGEVDANVKDRIVNYLRGGGFPVREYLGMQGGHMQWGDVNPQAVALRDEMIALVNTLPDVGNPIDEIVKAFKDVGISRITGKSNKNTEAAAFNNGDNLALVFSGAGGTGASYHADKRFKNQRQRVQIPIEFGWEPDKFLQALGRSHRNNQVVPPEFVLLTTDIAGEMRFMSTIANRVASMGAIVGGDRNSSGQVVSSGDSVQNKYGSDAINDVKRKLGAGRRIGEMYADEVLDAMFINPDKLDNIKPSQFLGRLQFLPVDEQSAIYGEIASQMERAIAKAKADGTFDDGIRKIDAKRVVVQSRESMSTGENEGQNRDLLTVSEWYDSPRIDHAAVEARVPEGQRIEYVRNRRSGKLYALISRSDGAFARLAPNGSYETVQPLERGNYETVIDKDAARKAWDDEYAALPAEVEYVRHYMSGDLIPVWDKIGVEGLIRVYRATPTGGRPFVGLQISEPQLPVTLYSFGKKDEARRFFKENGYRLAAREGANIGIGAKDDLGRQPYFKRAKIGTRYVLAVFQSGANPALEQSLIDGGWQGTWGRDDANSEDRGGQVYYRDFGEDAEAAFNAVIDQYGSVAYRGRNVGFESKDGLTRQAAEETPQRRGVSERPASAGPLGGQSPGRYRPDLVQTGAVRGNLRERVGMPQMRMRVQNGELIITNTDSRRKNDLKLAFGGEWANRARDGKRYVKSGLKWNPDPSGRGGWWSIPLDKVPVGILAEIEGDGVLRAPVAPLGSVAEMEREGGLARLSQNPDEFKATFMYNLLRSPVAELDGGKYAKEHESNLIRRAADDGDMSALGELYNRYMKPNADKGGLRGLVRRAAARKGMAGVMNESRIEEVASLVWAGTPVDGGYENNRRGIIADFNSGDTAIYKNAKSLIPVMTAKIDRILNDMAERAANRPEMLTLDAPSRSRDDESELDQQIADDSGAAEGLLGGNAANEYVEEADDTAEDVIAHKLGDIEGATGGRRLSRAERKRVEAMDMLDETMYFLPEDLQDVINAVLVEERKRGWIDPEFEKEKRIAKASFANAQKASGLGGRVFGYRYRTAKDLLNEIWRNIKNDKNDANIAIKAGSIDGAQESEEELNDEILQRIDEREPENDMTLAVRLLLRGESVADVADFFEISPAMVRAWKSRARNEHGITFPDEEVNPLGLGDFPERKAVKRGGSAPRAARPQATAWTPDLFAAANATVNDQQNFKIEEGIAAGAPDEQIARDAGVDKVIVKLAKIRKGETYQGTLWDEGALRSPVAPLEQGTLGVKTPDVADEIFGYTNAAENSWRSEHGYSEIPKGATVSLDAMHRRGAAMANNIDEMRRMVERLEKSPYAVNETDQIALGVFTAKMKGEYNRLSRLKAEQYANGNEAMAIQTDAEMDELFKWIDRAQRVNKDVGATWGRAGRARQLALDKAGNIADYMISCEKHKGSPLTKEERHQAERLFAELEKADVKLDEATMQDIIQHIDTISKARLAAQHDEVKERKAKKQIAQIERDYHEALAQIRFHGEKRSGGVLHGLPNGQKWIRALEAYHLLNGEGLTDGKPDGAKMVDLLVKDINGVGVEATAWDVRQLESRMGNLIKPSQDEISKSLRDLHAQMLVTQQIEHMMKTGEMPPKTGFDRDEDSTAVRALRRERDRTMRQLGIDRKTAEEMLKTALDSYKTRLRNQIEENEKAIADVESGKPYEKRGKRKLDLDDEAQALKARNDELKKRLDELTRDPAKELEAKIVRAMDAVAKTIAVRREQIAAIQAGTFDFDAKRPKLEDDRLASLRDELKALNAQKDALKKALFPYGTDAEVLHKLELREQAVGRSLDRWNGMAAGYTAATSWEDRAKAVAPSVKKNILDAEFASPEVKAAQQRIRDAQKQRDAARRKVLEYRAQLENEQDRLYAAKAWARFIGGTSVLARAIYDMSAVGIQGGKFLRSHPVKATKIAVKATKAFFTQKSADELASEIKSHPYFEDFKDNGGHIYKMDGLEGDVPEDFRVVEQGVRLPGGKVITAESIPGVKRSNRSFAGFLNKAALELYADMVEAAGPDGAGATDAQKKLIADFVNVTLGYGYGSKGASGKLGLVPAVLDALAWAPRKAVAELKYATGWNLLGSLNTRKNEISGKEIWNVDRQIGREYLRYTLGSLAFGACLLLLAKLINGDDDDDRNRWSDMLDPRSAEFGRVSIGNTKYSVFGGNEMVWRLFARLYTGQTKANGVVKDYRYHGIEAALNYLRGKLNPIYSAAVDVKMGENFVGEKLSDKSGLELARNYLLPLTANALYENFAKNPDDPLAAIFNAVPTFYGMTSSTYARDPLDRVVAQGDEAKRRAKAAAEAGDAETARRTMSALGERGETYGLVKEVQRLENNIKNLRKKGATDADLADGLKALAEAREKALKAYRFNRKKFKWDDMSWAE